MLEFNNLTAVSPIDGRYYGKTKELANYFSEYALIKYRIKVEIEYFIMLCELPLPQLKDFDKSQFDTLRAMYSNITPAEALRVKEIEQTTNHDVKAIEYYIKEKMTEMAIPECFQDFVHFGLTSQDINNTSFPLMLKDALHDIYIPLIHELTDKLNALAEEWKDIPMLAHTHGQPASPTRLGKEIKVFSYRTEQQLAELEKCKVTAKFGGATGNFNAHHVAYPDIDWVKTGNDFVNNILGLSREQFTTQISNYDAFAQIFDNLRRIDTIIIDLDRDIWQYISMNYFKQKIKAGEVGSSAMPHKVNPIDFENSEGNLLMANAILAHLSVKLPVSRQQRDLTDSTTLRNIGVPFGHIIISIQSTLKGLNKLLLNQNAIQSDLDDCWPVVAEGIQTILRREGYPHPYEALKQLTRTNTAITQETIISFINQLDVSDAVKNELRAISPSNYTGI